MKDFSQHDLEKKNIQINNNLDDKKLLVLLKEDNAYAWHCIYDKYAALMYGNILNIIKDKKNAEFIFIKVFILLKEQNFPIPVQCSMSIYLSIYAKKYANEYKNLS